MSRSLGKCWSRIAGGMESQVGSFGFCLWNGSQQRFLGCGQRTTREDTFGSGYPLRRSLWGTVVGTGEDR